MKQNDWIVANINNPEFTEADFKNIQGLSIDNTQLLPMESYLNSKFITDNDLFKKEDGTFSKDKFEEFYKNQAARFGNFQTTSALDNYEYDFWDIYQQPTSRIKNPNFNLQTTLNPEHVSTGVIGPNMQGERTKSDFELAEKQKIFDWETQSYKDLTPDDMALFTNPIRFIQNLFSNPLVLAEYEQDEIDPITGEQHYKGDKKLNENGEYYFETLGNRSIVGKKILSIGDTITKEDSLINKYDFFDSDDLEKSISGVIAKNIVAIAPMALLSTTGAAWYSGFYIAREVAKSLPMLYNILTMWSDAEDPKLLNTIAGLGEKFTGGTSTYSKNATFSFENFGNLIADVAVQWGQQKLIANSISKIKNNANTIVNAAEAKAALEYEKRAKDIWNRANNAEDMFDALKAQKYTGATGFDGIKEMISTGNWKETSVGAAAMQKFIPEAQKAFSKQAQLGQDLSLIYMAMISNYDVYNSALEHGATKLEAAAVALGSTLGMFVVDKYAHLGEIFFDETPEKMALRNLRQGIVDEATELSKRIASKETKEITKKGLVDLMKEGAKTASNFVKNYQSGLKNHTLGFFGKAFGEGLEEMSEEGVTDLIKSLYELAGQFGYASQTDIGAWDNMRERYLMSLFGGAIGGGIFYGVDAIRNPKNTVDQNIQKELLYLVSQGKTNDILDNLEDLRKKGQLASKDLSIDTTEDSNGNKIFLTADEDHKSQNDYIYDIMKNSILQMESILNEHGLKLNDDQLFEKMVLSNQRYMALKNNLFDKSYITQYYDDFQQIVSDIFNIEKKIQNLKDSTKDEDKREDNSTYQEQLKTLEEEKTKLLNTKESFLKGEYNLDYVDKMLFYIHPEVNSNFYSSLYEQWVQETYHKDVKDLSEGESKKYSEEWTKLKKTQGKQLLNKAFDLYKGVRTKLEEGLKEVSKDDIRKGGELLEQLEKFSPESYNLNYDDRVPSRTVDIDKYLDSLGIVKTPEYDKAWRNDPSKKNKAFQLQLEEDSSAGFEIVKDIEDGYWSIHFKTPRTLTNNQKMRLFRAAAIVIPEGDKLSTWGELTKGGVSGINRFGQLDFLGGIEFEQVGTRKVYQRNTYSGLSVEQLKEALEEQKSHIGEEKVLDRNLYYNIEQINSELEKQGEEGFNLSEYTPSNLESTNYVQEIEIPIWQRTLTGETDEDYKDRNTQRTGESEEEFKQRKKSRYNKLLQYNNDNFIKNIKKFLNVNDMIDRSTYRRLVAKLGVRRSDILKHIIKQIQAPETIGIVTVGNKAKFNNILYETLPHLHPNFDNREDVVQEIINKTRSLRSTEFNKKNSHRKVVIETTRLPEQFQFSGFDENWEFTLDRIVDDLDVLYDNQKIDLTQFDDFKDSFYIMQNFENSPLFNQVLETAIRIHNLKIDDQLNGTDSRDQIAALEQSLEEVTLESGRLLLLDNGNDEENPGTYGYEKAQVTSEQVATQETILNNLIDEIESDEDLKTLNELHKKATLDLNPIIKVLKAVLPKLGEDFGDLEETLESIYNQFESLEIPTSFTLTSQQLAALEKVNKYFDYITAIVLAAKTKSNYFNFLPYNNSINTFIDDNKDVIKNVEKLLELDDDIANVIEESLRHFGEEMKQWIRSAQRGTINKREMFSKFDQRFRKAQLDFFNQLKDQCKVGEKDLFKGFEHIDVDKPDAIVEVEKLIYNNFKKQGWTESDFISILSKQVKAAKVLEQKTGIGKSLDQDFVFTDYDKFILLTSLVATDPVDFYEFYKNYVNNSKGKDGQKLAPLTFQEYNIKLGYIHKNAMPFINKILDEYAKKENIKANILKNAIIIEGIAGVGKTDVVIRALQDSTTVIVSGPSSTQIEALKKIIPHAETLGHKELFTKIIGQDTYAAILKEIQDCTTKKKDLKAFSGKYLVSSEKQEYATINFDKINFIINDAPKQVVIDEITLFSNVELLILSEWANKAGTQLIFAGDKHQNGNKQVGINIVPDFTFAFRAPEMRISLRDANIWKYKNQQELVNQINDLEEFQNAEQVIKYLSNFNFHYYLNNDKFTGELVTDQLDNSVIKTLKGSIAFIGDTSSTNYQKLKSLGKDIEVYKSIEDIQGNEFDYIIADIDLEYTPEEGFSDYYNLLTYLNKLYTLITRSKTGSILIDNGLTKSIKGSVQEQFSNNNVGITPEITEQYIKEKLEFLNSLNLSREIPLEIIEEPLKENTIIEGKNYEEEEPQEEELEPETEEDSYLDIEAQQETITPVYGNLNFSGLVRDRNTNKLHKVGNRDLGIFLEDNAEIEIKDRPLEDLFQLKSILLFDKIDNWYSKLRPNITRLFSQEDLKNIKYYVSAEDYNPETHRLLTKEAGYKEGQQAFTVNGVKKVFTLIGVIEKNGKQYEITLGGLSNPKTLRENSKDKFDPKTGKLINKGTITRIRERASRTTDDELKQKLLDYANNYDSKVNYYESQLIRLTERGKWQINKPSFDRCTRISRLYDEEGNRQYYPLNDLFKLNTSQYVVSPVYTQVNSNDEEIVFPGLDDKYKGKPVIFVSAFTLYSPEELANIYEEQKANPESSYPEVRKIILDPRGVFFEDLVNGKVVGLENSDELRFPFSNTATSFRLYMSLWNFRAKITKFNDAVDEYLNKNNLSIQEIEKLAKEEAQYYASNPNGPRDDRFKALYDLNDYLDTKEIQQFRLGYNEKNGFYSREIKPGVSGTFINYQMAQDYQKVSETLFKNVIDKLIPPPSADAAKTIMGKTSDFDKKRALDTWVRKLSSNREILIQLKSDDTNKIVPFKISKADLFKSLPLNLVQMCRNFQLAQFFNGGGIKRFRQLLEDDQSLYSYWYIKVKDDRTNEYEYLDYLSLADSLTGGLQDAVLTGTPVLSPGIVQYDESGGSYDRRLINFFNLAFHGKVGDGQAAQGTLLEHGIFADTFTIGRFDANHAFKVSTTNRELYRLNAMPSSPVLKIDITEFDGNVQAEEQEQQESFENIELTRVNNLLGTMFDSLSAVPIYIDNQISSLFESILSPTEALNTIVQYSNNNGTYTFKTLKEVIREKTGLEISTITGLQNENNIQYQFQNNGQTFTISLINEQIHIEKPQEFITTPQEFQERFIEIYNNNIAEFDTAKEDMDDEDITKFDQYISDFKSAGSLNSLQDIKDNLNAFFVFLSENDQSITSLSKLKNQLDKAPC